MTLCLAPLIVSAGEASSPIERAQQKIAAGEGQAALRLLRPLARHGDAEAAYWLGRLYFYDEAGVARNDRESFRWFSLAAQAGHAGGQYKLGSLYYLGRGVPRDVGLALRWWAKAALQGHAEALNNLGALITMGEGVTADPDLGHALQILGAEKGSEAAQENLRHKEANEMANRLANQFAEHPEILQARLDALFARER